MSQIFKIGIPIIVVIAIIGGVFYSRSLKVKDAELQSSSSTNQTAIVLSKGSSNADLDKDMTSIDTQMSASDNDFQSVDKGLYDQPISQE